MNSNNYNGGQNAYSQSGFGAPEPLKKNRSGIIIVISLFIIVAAAGVGAYFYLNRVEPDDTELRAYEMLDGNEEMADYEAFMEQYPESPRVRDVRMRYENLKRMYEAWNEATTGNQVRDYMLFQKNYPNSSLVKVCETKIDSLDWVEAKKKGAQEDLDAYLRKHPNGRYAQEATDSRTKIVAATASTEEKLLIEETLRGFFMAYGNADTETIYTLITPTMTRFLTRQNATKADVSDIIERTYNEHILSCKFVLNNDTKVKKENGPGDVPLYRVSFTVDQHIERDNEGKTFGSYTADAVLTDQYKLQSLTMNEVSRK